MGITIFRKHLEKYDFILRANSKLPVRKGSPVKTYVLESMFLVGLVNSKIFTKDIASELSI